MRVLLVEDDSPISRGKPQICRDTSSESCLKRSYRVQRSAAKAINFGSIYGMGPGGLVRHAWKQFGIELTEPEAKLALDRFFTTYAGLKQWMRTHARQCARARRVVIGAGRVVGKYGLGYPQLCNLPVQGICADCMMRAIALAHVELGGGLVAMVHDELIAEVAENGAEAAAETLRACLHRAFVETFPGAPTAGLVDAHRGASWAELKGAAPSQQSAETRR